MINEINDFYNSKQVEKQKNKKVVRRNKHASKKIIAGGLSLVILGSCVYGFFSKENRVNAIDNYTYNNSVVSKVENFVNSIVDEFNDKENNNDIINLSQKNKELDSVSIEYEDRSDTEKAYITKSYYSSLINKYADMYGIDPVLVTAVATQESGVHSSITSPGGATGLMQIQNSVWLGENVSAYNFETNSMETFTVTLDKIQDLEYNIKIGCMILQNAFQYMNYNTLAAIQCYNMGYGNMMDILNHYADDTNQGVDQILKNPEDIGWLSYRSYIDEGDQKYVEHVLSWIGEDFDLKNVKVDGSLVDINIDNNLNSKKMY